MNSFWENEFWLNTVEDYAIAAGIILGSFIIIQLIKLLVLKRIEKTTSVEEEDISARREFLIQTVKKLVIPFLYLAGFYVAMESLTYTEIVYKILKTVFIILATWFAVRYVIILVAYLINSYFTRVKRVEDTTKLKPVIGIFNMIIYIIGFVFILDNLGFEIGTIIAGLGISGIAVALAAQTVLGDLFAYFVVIFDKPFEIGDFLIFNDKLGAVEKVGFKSTRIRSLTGEQLIVSNSDLTNARVHNYKRMMRRRVAFGFGVTYQTPYEQVKEIPGIVKDIITNIPDTTFDRSHFKAYGNFSLDYEVVYYVLTNDYTKYMDIQQEINLRLYEEFEKRGVQFAYPTQTLYLNKDETFDPNQDPGIVK